MTHLVLAGGGHAHLSVLERLARGKPPGMRITLVTPTPFQYYSGMLPGWMAGHYALNACCIDLRPLAEAAGATLITEHVLGMDADRHHIRLANGRTMAYDLLSLDVGSETDTSGLQALGDRLLPVKPLDDFFDAWPQVLATASRTPDFRLSVIGGGAAGVELALAANHALRRDGSTAQIDLIVSEAGLLPDHAPGVIRRARRQLAKTNIALHCSRASAGDAGLVLAGGTRLPAHKVIATTGARALGWLGRSGLAVDAHGFILVDAHHRSLSHADVFAAGDTCARADVRMARSGVHAVHAGPILAHNLIATIEGNALRTYRPHPRSLYLLATGPRHAIASWGRWSAEGNWVWHLKDHIDRAFIARFVRISAA
ncbi:FAD-dependent oxidoreductase [Azoarcus sp. L1K30]|uniref:FAD-dependent oxidoreductase n=1 Tax=Azoarcus sp. L1K30 TaxID=2820277 RepID=UPI001B80F01C|nr:FAD-dependent oxidoreductase [Azoarcus sp. L1K30]